MKIVKLSFPAPYREWKLSNVKLKLKIISSFTPYKDSNHRFNDLFSKKFRFSFPTPYKEQKSYFVADFSKKFQFLLTLHICTPKENFMTLFKKS